MVNAEILPLASRLRRAGAAERRGHRAGKGGGQGHDVESEMVDLTKLCLIPGKSVVTVFVDCNMMNVDGNLFDATSYAVVAALRTSKMKKYKVKDDKVEAGEDWVPVPSRRTPVSVTLARIGDKPCCRPEHRGRSGHGHEDHHYHRRRRKHMREPEGRGEHHQP